MTREQRELIRTHVLALMEDDAGKLLLQQYTKALSKTKKIIGHMYDQYAINGTLTYAEMTKYNRFQSVFDSVSAEITDLVGAKERTIKRLSRDVYEYEYFHEAYELNGFRKDFSLRSDWMMLNKDQLEASVQNPLSGLTLNDRLKAHREEIIRNAKGAMTQGLILGEDYGTIARRMKGLFEGDATKALRVARTECHRLQNEGKHAIEQRAREAGVKFDKEWVHSGDSDVRDEHLALGGQIADSEGYFHFQGLTTQYPGGFGNAKLDINCRCRYRMIPLKKNGERFTDNQLVTGETFEEWGNKHGMIPHSTLGDWVEKDRLAWEELKKQYPDPIPTPVQKPKPINITDVSKASYQDIDDYISQHAQDNKQMIELMGKMITGNVKMEKNSFQKGLLAHYTKGLNKLRKLLNLTDRLPLNQLTSHQYSFNLQALNQQTMTLLKMMSMNYKGRYFVMSNLQKAGIRLNDLNYCKLLERFVQDIDAGKVNTTIKYNKRIQSLSKSLQKDKWTIMARTGKTQVNNFGELIATYQEAFPLEQMAQELLDFQADSGFAYTSVKYLNHANRRFSPIVINEYANNMNPTKLDLKLVANYLIGEGNVPSLEDVLIHEYGHIIDGVLCELDPGWEQWRTDYYYRHILGAPRDQARKNRMNNAIYPRISGYALMNEREMVAEAFIDVLVNSDATPYSREVYRRMFQNFSVEKIIKHLYNLTPDPIHIVGFDVFKKKKI